MNKPKVHKCEECGESFRHGIGLLKHQRTTGHENPETEQSSLTEDVEKLKTLLDFAPKQADPEWESALEEITKSLALKQMQVNAPNLKLAPEFTAQIQDMWESLHGNHLYESYASSLDCGLGHALGYKMVDWMWEQIRPTLRTANPKESYAKLTLSVKPGERKLFKGVLDRALQTFALETGVLPPGVNFEESSERVLTWNGVKLAHVSCPKEATTEEELSSCLVRNASRLLCVKQVDSRLTDLWASHPELQRAYKETDMKLMKTVGVFRELLDLGENLNQLPLLIELLTKHDLRYLRADLVEAIQRDLRALGLSRSGTTRETESPSKDLFAEDVSVEVGRGLLSLVNPKYGATLLQRVKSVRKALSQEFGFIMPGVRFIDNLQLSPNEIRISIKEVEIYRFPVQMGCIMLLGPQRRLQKVRGVHSHEPIKGMPVVWADPELREEYENLGFMVFAPESVAGMALAEALRCHMHRLFSTQCFHAHLDILKKTEPTLAKLYGEDLPLARVGKLVMSRLLEERVSLRNSVAILETLMEQEEEERNAYWSTELVRKALCRRICQRNLHEDGELYCFILSTAIRSLCHNALKVDTKKSWLELQPSARKRLFRAMNNTIEYLQERGLPQVLIVESNLRRPLFEFFRDTIPDLVVLSLDEVAHLPEVHILAEMAEPEVVKRPTPHQRLQRHYSRQRVKPTRMYKRKRSG